MTVPGPPSARRPDPGSRLNPPSRAGILTHSDNYFQIKKLLSISPTCRIGLARFGLARS
jgi:hypothetical protein